jgi:hypothetical protein
MSASAMVAVGVVERGDSDVGAVEIFEVERRRASGRDLENDNAKLRRASSSRLVIFDRRVQVRCSVGRRTHVYGGMVRSFLNNELRGGDMRAAER